MRFQLLRMQQQRRLSDQTQASIARGCGKRMHGFYRLARTHTGIRRARALNRNPWISFALRYCERAVSLVQPNPDAIAEQAFCRSGASEGPNHVDRPAVYVKGATLALVSRSEMTTKSAAAVRRCGHSQ